jgi:hypothetical protein
VRSVDVTREEEIPEALATLGLDSPRPVVVVVGGAAGLDADDPDLQALGDAIARAAERGGAVIVDGGTDSGVMRLVGRAAGSRMPLVGVVVRALAALPDQPLEPHHTHFILVPGSSWGEEAPWIARVATAVAGSSPSVTVLVNGGEIAWTDVAESVAAGRSVLAVAGTGRTADALVAALADGPRDDRAARLVATGLVLAVGSGTGLSDLVERRIEQFLMPGGTAA